jgi:Tol biopolymer transport system component
MKQVAPLFLLVLLTHAGIATDAPAGGSDLASEVSQAGWIAFSAQTETGDWDLFVMRPDGTHRHALTRTADYNEAGVRFSPNGKRMLYYRMTREEPVDNNTYGTHELVVADANGANPTVIGRDFPWASWGPDSSQIACVTADGIHLIDLATRKLLNTRPREGIFQQLIWSPDGKRFVGTANGLGAFWNIGCVAMGGKLAAVSEIDRYNCTPDWMPDSSHLLYARGIVPNDGGRAQLWMADADGSKRMMLYAEAGCHIYGACASPDGHFLLFTRSVEDLGPVANSQTTMALVRRADTPMIGHPDDALRKQFPQARVAAPLDLGPGWEPHWTFSEAPGQP